VDDEVYAEMWELLNGPDGIALSDALAGVPADARTASPGEAPGLESSGSGEALPPPLPALVKRGEVFPANTAFVIGNGGVEAAKWGFPHWKRSGVIINARSETALEKNMFRGPLMRRRCVIPSSGFYEWSRGGGKLKDKYLLRLPGERVLYMAGMISIFRDSGGCEYSAFVILTTAANESMAPIHDRMPVILAPDEREQWIGDDDFMRQALRRPGPELVSHPGATSG